MTKVHAILTRTALASGLAALTMGASQCPTPPPPGTKLQWVLDGSFTALPAGSPAKVVDFDFRQGEDESLPASDSENQAAIAARRKVVADLQASGIQVICYMPAGDWENYRRDWSQLADGGHLGGAIEGFPSERWVNFTGTHRAAVDAAIAARMDECKADGFDGVEPDEIEASDNGNVGFAVTDDEQLDWNLGLAKMAHDRGLLIIHKGIPRMAAAMQPTFDAALVEECFGDAERRGQCEGLSVYTQAGKAVWIAEYTGRQSGMPTRNPAACDWAAAAGRQFSILFKNENLDNRVVYCD